MIPIVKPFLLTPLVMIVPITADDNDSNSSMEDKSCVWEAASTGIEASLHRIASGLQNAAEG